MKTSPVRRSARGKPERIPRIGVLVETSTTWGRGVVSGIQRYAEIHGPWLTFIEPHGAEERVMLPSGWRGDGVIARVAHSPLAAELQAMNIPVVNVSAIQLPGKTFPCVTTDLTASGKLAASYFLDRGFRSFGYFSLLGLHYVTSHQQAFAEKLKEAGYPCAVYSVRPRRGAELDWNHDLAELGKWLDSLPKPVAMLSWNATSSREVLFACQLAGLLVPEEVSILSGSDDDLLCAKAHIPISGIQVPAEQIGYRAAELLDGLMRRQKPKSQTVLVTPSGISGRRSSDTLAISDKALVKAINFIRNNADKPIQVLDVSTYSGLSRRALERRFEAVLGRSPASEIRRAHMERAKELLTNSDMPVPDVAEKSGFGSPEYLSFMFRRELGKTPLKFRRAGRSR